MSKKVIILGVGIVLALGIGIVAASGVSGPPNPTVKAIPLHVSDSPPVSSVTPVVTGTPATTGTNAPSAAPVAPSVTPTTTGQVGTVTSTIPVTTAACSFTFEPFTTADNRPALGIGTFNDCTPATVTMTYSDASGTTFTVSTSVPETSGTGSVILTAPAYGPDGTHSTSLVRVTYSFDGVTGGYSAAQLPEDQLTWGTA